MPEGWLVMPHASPTAASTLTAADVTRIVNQGIAEARLTRAAIRLNLKNIKNGFAQPGVMTRMVFAVADRDGNVLGLYRMFDATVFSIDVAVAKARNTAYYANAALLKTPTRSMTTCCSSAGRRPRQQLRQSLSRFDGVNNHLADLNPTPNDIGQILAPRTGWHSPTARSASWPSRAIRRASMAPCRRLFEPEHAGHQPQHGRELAARAGQRPAGVELLHRLWLRRLPHRPQLPQHARTSPTRTAWCSSPAARRSIWAVRLQGGFGVSGDGVDQDDVVTFTRAARVTTRPPHLRADRVFYRGVRLPFQKFNRNPQGGIVGG